MFRIAEYEALRSTIRERGSVRMCLILVGVIAWGVDDVESSEPTEPYRDAYLTPFVAAHGGADLVAATTIARRLGWICRAVNGHLAPFESEQTGRRLRMFLDGMP